MFNNFGKKELKLCQFQHNWSECTPKYDCSGMYTVGTIGNKIQA